MVTKNSLYETKLDESVMKVIEELIEELVFVSHRSQSLVADYEALPSRGQQPVSHRPLGLSDLLSEASPHTPPDWVTWERTHTHQLLQQLQALGGLDSNGGEQQPHLRLLMFLRARLRTIGLGSWQSFLSVLMTSRDSSGFKVA